jgi:hypothetical protein
MHNSEIRPDNRRPVGYFVTPVTVTDKDGREINFRSPRKLRKALVSVEPAALSADIIIAGKVRVVP